MDKGANLQFVVTSLDRKLAGTKCYTKSYTVPEEKVEKRIKEQKLNLLANRTSTAMLRANANVDSMVRSIASVPREVMEGQLRLPVGVKTPEYLYSNEVIFLFR